MSISPTPQNDDTGSGRTRNHTGLIISAVVVAAIVVAGGFAIYSNRSKTPETTTVAPTPSATAKPNPSATGFALPTVDPFGRRVDTPNNEYGQPLDQTGQPRSPSDPQWLTAPPALPRDRGGWQRVTGAVVPFSTSDGPTAIADGVPVGYSHTPQGCALAAAFVVLETVARPGDWNLRDRMVVVTAQDRADFERMKSAGRIPDRAPEAVQRWLLASDAYKINSWSDDLCTVSLASKNKPDNGPVGWLSNQVAMVWDGTAWKMQLPPTKQLPQQTLTSITGWTAW